MQSALPPPAPSRSLLRFLRFQSRRAFSLSANHGHGPDAIVASALCRRTQASNPTARKQPRPLATTCERRNATLEASFLDLQPILRRFRSKDQLPNPRSTFSTTRDVRSWFGLGKSKKDSTTWQERILGGSSAAKGLKPDDLPNHEEFDNTSMFSSRRSLAAKAASEPRLRCTEVDEHGNVILMDGEFKKTELIAKVRSQKPLLRAEPYADKYVY